MRTRGREIMSALQRKFGPLPAWAWALIGGVALYLYRQRTADKSGGLQTAAAKPVDGLGAGSGSAPTGGQSPVTLAPGESVYDPNTGALVSTAPDQQPGSGTFTPDQQAAAAPIILQPGESFVDPGGHITTAPFGPPAQTGKPGGTGKAGGAGAAHAPASGKRTNAQIRKDNPAMVARVKKRLLKQRRQHQPSAPVPHHAPTPVRPARSGGAVKPQATHPGPTQTGGTAPAAPSRNRTSVKPTVPAQPRAAVAASHPVTVVPPVMRQRPAAPTVKAAAPPKPAPKPAPKNAPRKR